MSYLNLVSVLTNNYKIILQYFGLMKTVLILILFINKIKIMAQFEVQELRYTEKNYGYKTKQKNNRF